MPAVPLATASRAAPRETVLVVAFAGLLVDFVDEYYGREHAGRVREAVAAVLDGFDGPICWLTDPDFDRLRLCPRLHEATVGAMQRGTRNVLLPVGMLDERQYETRAVTAVLRLMEIADLSPERHAVRLTGAFSNGSDGPLDLLFYAFSGLRFCVRQ